METIAIFNTKGGVGKSALTVFLADFLSSKEDQRVLVLDLDPQHFLSTALVGEPTVRTHLESQEHSLPRLMWDSRQQISREQLQAAVLSRPSCQGRGKFTFLQQVDAMLGPQADWEMLETYLHDQAGEAELQGNFELLRNLLKPLRDDYDLCLIDFPANNRGPVSKNGIRAAKWWLLPVKPIPNELDALDLAKGVIDDLSGRNRIPIAPLLTIPTMVHDRNSNTYREARRNLIALATADRIPPLITTRPTKDGEVSQGTAAINAIAAPYSQDQPTTLAKKYGGTGSPLYKALAKISKEVVTRAHQLPTSQLKKGSLIDLIFRRKKS
jgi:cellulose biosynthesis protein BcsQ